jgi:hypothetical protein
VKKHLISSEFLKQQQEQDIAMSQNTSTEERMATRVIPETAKNTEKRKAVRSAKLDFSNLTAAPKKTRFSAEHGEESTSDLPQCPPQRLSYDKSSEPILKLRSDEQGATITLGSKWDTVEQRGILCSEKHC